MFTGDILQGKGKRRAGGKENGNEKATNINELSFGNLTLLKIKNGKIVLYLENINDIKKEKAAKNEKKKDSENLIKAINDYAAKYYPELELSLDSSGDEIIKIFDEVKHYSEIFDAFTRNFFKD